MLDFYLTFLELVFIHLHCKRLPQIRKLDWSNLSNYLQGILRDKTIFFTYFYVDPNQSQEAGFEFATWSSTVTIIFQLKKHLVGSPLTQTRCFSRKMPWQSWKKKCPLINLDSASVSNKGECSTFPQSLRASVKLYSSIHEARRMYSPKPVAHLWRWLMKTSFWWEFVPIGEKKMVIKTLVNEGKAMIKIDFTITLLLNSK